MSALATTRRGAARRVGEQAAANAFTSVRRGVVGAVVLTLVFEGFARLELIDPQLLPPATVILPKALTLLVDPAFLTEVWATLSALLLGMLIAAVIAVPLGIVLGSYRPVATAFTPVIDALRSVPGIAIIPLIVLVLGQGLEMKITIVVFVTLWPLLFNTMYGVQGVDRVAVETARSFHVPTLMMWRRVVLPSALPLMLTGIRLALSTGLTVAIAAEIAVGTSDGIGYFILRASYAGFNADTVFAAVVLAGLLGYLLNVLTTAASARLVAWDRRGAS
ncbi:ABC transporter permease [Actinocrispum wychmicini]|uniref:NitT/TauT family transport system permease protein n=1 Tax=Actinocrispum wychmicini TaxID=1213861 RepID=A0A4V2S875_9PSEU|nr:ABC transporter permease [Actinocrispum wychmicini]TCO62760.1 NitT/TauT family transport system permease protein [Actinocrispum wychmicini]